MAAKLIVLSAFLAVASAYRFTNPMENPDLYHGDIAGDHTHDRNAITSMKRRWPDGAIPYRIDSSLQNLRPLIYKVMDHLEAKTCLRFEGYDGTQDGYMRIFAGEGCYSHWGRTGGEQPVSIGKGCENFGIILHEFVHAIGFDHEQNRSDRDDYLIIYYENILEGAEDQFRKLKPHENWLITPFDFNSIMMYAETSFSKDGYSKTMVAKQRGVKFTGADAKTGLSPSDIVRIKTLYECK